MIVSALLGAFFLYVATKSFPLSKRHIAAELRTRLPVIRYSISSREPIPSSLQDMASRVIGLISVYGIEVSWARSCARKGGVAGRERWGERCCEERVRNVDGRGERNFGGVYREAR